MKLLPNDPDNSSREVYSIEEPTVEEFEQVEEQYSYNDITVSEIKEILDERGVEYTNNMKKQELFDLL